MVLVVDMEAVVDMSEVTVVVVAVIVEGLVVLSMGVELEVVLEAGIEDEALVATLFEECLPTVAPRAPPKAAPNTTRRAKRPKTSFLRDRLREFGEASPSSPTAAVYPLLEAAEALTSVSSRGCPT